MHRLRILVVNGRHLVSGQMKELHLRNEIQICETGDPGFAVKILEETNIDLAIIDTSCLNGKAVSFIKSLRSTNPELDLIVIACEESTPGCTGHGVQVFRKAPDGHDLKVAIETSHSYKRFLNQHQQLESNFQKFSREINARGGQKIIGISKSVKSIASLILLVSQSEDTSVMITGESGTGKELVARGIHTLSSNYNNTFHGVNCSAIPESLFESEFFGYRKGAFTGALEKSTGWFELANNSTLFLDEVTELPLCMQSKFLRVLDDKVIHQIGSHQEVCLNLRIISATNQDVNKLIEKKIFREDLFHRLNTFNIHIPPLRERLEDIPVLLDHFISKFSSRMNKPVKQVDEQALRMLMNYPFPGNVRELKNLVEGAVILSEERKLMPKHFRLNPEAVKRNLFTSAPPVTLFDLEKNAIITALRQSRNNKSQAARLLSISRQALDRRLLKLKIA